MRIFFAIITLFAGLLLLFRGYRLARIIIPLMGFIFGLSLGGAVISDMNSTPFLGTLLGVMIGVTAGLLLAVIAYMYYYVAVVVLGASLGYWAGSGFVLLLGFSPGLLSALIGITLGIIVGVLCVISNAPRYVLILLTSLAGSTAVVGGVLLLFNQIPLAAFSYTTVRIALSASFFWSLVALAGLAVGIVAQVRTTNEYDEFEEWTVGSHHMPPTTTPHVPVAH